MSQVQLDIAGVSGLASGLNVMIGIFAGSTNSVASAFATLAETVAGQGSYAFSGPITPSFDGDHWAEIRSGSAATLVAFNAATNAAQLVRPRWYLGYSSGGVYLLSPPATITEVDS